MPGPPSPSPVTIRKVSPSVNSMGRPPASRPVRIFGPLKSCMIPTIFPVLTAACLMRWYVSACLSCDPWEKFNRQMSTPASIRLWRMASL
jgi:hypothetical protein